MKAMLHTLRVSMLAILATTVLARGQQGLPQRLDHSSPAERRAAVQAVGELGDRARPFVPKLIEHLGDADLDVALAVVEACARLGVAADVAAAAASLQGRALLAAAAALGRGTAAPSANAAAGRPAAAIERQAVLSPLVDAAFDSDDPRERSLASSAMGMLTECGVALGSKLLAVLQEKDSVAAAAASDTVARHSDRLGPLIRAVLSATPSLASSNLVAALPESTPEQIALLADLAKLCTGQAQRDALFRLGGLGPRAGDQLAAVESALTAPLAAARQAAVWAAAMLSTDEDRTAAMLATALLDTDPTVVRQALQSLQGQRLRLQRSTERLVALLDDDVCRSDAAQVLTTVPRVLRDALKPALESSSTATQAAALQALAGHGLFTERDLQLVLGWLHSREDPVRHPALDLVTALAGSQPKLMPAVLDLLRGTDRTRAMAAAASFGPAAADAGKRLLAAVKDKDPAVRAGAATALALVLPGRREAIDALVRGAKDAESGAACLDALGRMQQGGKPAVDDLCRLLAQKDFKHRRSAISALAWIGDIDDAAVELLRRLVTDGRDDDERSSAVAALRQARYYSVPYDAGKLPNRWRGVVKTLLEAARTDPMPVRIAAIETLGALTLDDTVLPFLREGLREEGPVLAAVLRSLLQATWTWTPAEIERVGNVLEHGLPALREPAALVLARGGPGRLVGALANQDPAVRDAALQAVQALPRGTDCHDELFAAMSTANRHARQGLAWYFSRFANDAATIDRALAEWDKAGEDLARRRTLAEIAAAWVRGTSSEKARLLKRLEADDDPIVAFHAATVRE